MSLGAPPISEGQPLSERIRSLADPVKAYEELGVQDKLILDTASELASDMTYLGMDDAIIDIAAKVKELEDLANERLRLLNEARDERDQRKREKDELDLEAKAARNDLARAESVIEDYEQGIAEIADVLEHESVFDEVWEQRHRASAAEILEEFPDATATSDAFIQQSARDRGHRVAWNTARFHLIELLKAVRRRRGRCT